jgi:hypothetical protein
MYGTTREFLERFGLNELADLPKVDELADALGFELPGGLAEPTITTSPLPFDDTPPSEPSVADDPAADAEQGTERIH